MRKPSIEDRKPGTPQRLWVVLLSFCAVFLLSGCLLISGPVESTDNTPEGGNVYVGFVSAEGVETRVVQTPFVSQRLAITVFARNERGQMRIEILDENGSVAFSIEGQAQDQTRPGVVETNAVGEFRYRVRATGAQRGEFQILYQPTNG